MTDPKQAFLEMLNNVLPGSLSTLFGAFLGRAMWLGGEIRAKKRSLLNWELLWEIPTVFGMWLIGLGLVDYYDLRVNSATAVCAVLTYLGPKGIAMLVMQWRGDKSK